MGSMKHLDQLASDARDEANRIAGALPAIDALIDKLDSVRGKRGASKSEGLISSHLMGDLITLRNAAVAHREYLVDSSRYWVRLADGRDGD